MPSSTVRRVSAAAGGVALLLTAGVSPSEADGSGYVALGDSYSAGVGTKAKVDDCYRSSYGYPVLVAQSMGTTLDYQACSGATTSDVLASQVSSLSASTAYVSITIGGNDVGFTAVLTECAKPAWMSNCDAAIDGAQATIRDTLPGRLDSVYAQVTSRAPSASFVVAGYPRLFNGEDCNALTFFSPAEETRLNASSDQLSSTIAGRAAAHGATYVDPRGAFVGHAVCDDPEWLNGLSNPIEESYHPDRAGNVAYGNLVAPQLSGQAIRISAAKPTNPALPAVPSRTSPVPQVTVPDLTSPESLRAAKKAGLDPQEVRRLAQQLRSDDPSTARAAKRGLDRLDRQATVNLEATRSAGHAPGNG